MLDIIYKNAKYNPPTNIPFTIPFFLILAVVNWLLSKILKALTIIITAGIVLSFTDVYVRIAENIINKIKVATIDIAVPFKISKILFELFSFTLYIFSSLIKDMLKYLALL
jgi:hypothetical protein